MEKSYTLKEAAELLGMTKAGIRYRMNSLGMMLNKDAFGRIVLSDADMQRLREGKVPESRSESGGKNREESERKPESFEKIPERIGKFRKESESDAEAVALDVLREQIAAKDREIERLNAKIDAKDRRIDELTDELTNALHAAQVLHASTVKQLQEAQEPEPVTVDGTEEHDEMEKPRRGLFDWLKRGK